MPSVWTLVQGLDANDDVILCGDFNLNVGHDAFEDLLGISDGMVCASEDAGATKIGNANTYDQIFLDTAHTAEWTGEAYVGEFDIENFGDDDAAANLAVSDHRPVWVTLWVPGEDDD